MNIEKLKERQVVKNYKELCELIEESVKNGASKRSQLKEFERFVKYHKEGNKFVIEEIYEEPLEKIDNRKFNKGGNNNIDYIEYIETLILNMLAEEQDKNYSNGILLLSKNTILSKLSMINNNYAFCKGRVNKLGKYLQIDKDNIYDFYENTDNTLINNLEKALNNLANKMLIRWSKKMTICECANKYSCEGIEDVITLDKYDEEQHLYKKEYEVTYREATDEEEQMIVYFEKEALNTLKRENRQEVVKNKEWKEFKNLVKEKIIDYGLLFYFDSYKIIFNEEHILNELIDTYSFILSKEDKGNKENNLNESIVKRLKDNLEKRKTRVVDKYSKGFGLPQNEKDRMRLKEDYEKIYIKLIELLVKDSSLNITENIRKQKLD